MGSSEALQLSGDEFKGREFCIVRSCMTLDVMVPDDTAIQIEAQHLSSIVLYAGEIVFAGDLFNVHGYRRSQGLPTASLSRLDLDTFFGAGLMRAYVQRFRDNSALQSRPVS